MKYKIYCIFSRESLKALGGNRGKFAAQAGHAYLHSFWNSEALYPELAYAYRHSEHAYKICLIVDTNEELEKLYLEYRAICGTTRVVDSAFTVLEHPMLTCVGIGPISEEHMTESLKSLKVLI